MQLRTLSSKKIRFSGSRKGIQVPERATVIYRGSYPMVLAEASGGGVALIETTMANPYVRPRGTTGISMGCCATMIYEVLETGEEGARLRLRSSKDPQKETRWYWSAEACRDKR